MNPNRGGGQQEGADRVPGSKFIEFMTQKSLD
jgi:hypothetical protein